MTLEEFFTIFIPQFIIFLIVIIVFLFICWVFSLFFFPRKDVLSQAFSEIFTQEQQDYIKANYKQVIIREKTLDELTDETLKIETED